MTVLYQNFALLKTRHIFLLSLLLFSAQLAFSQQGQRGKIITACTATIMDPNKDGYVSKTKNGFSNDGYYVDEFELPMFGIPKLGGDVTNDNIGQSCGITDLIPDRDGHAVYALRDANNNLIFRFRVGRNNSSVEAWTILLDTDGKFGANDPNSTPENPGFEIDITLIKRNNSGVLVYNIDGVEKCGQPLKKYSIRDNFQIAIADEVSCGDPDYFYDFFVPFNEIAPLFNIDVNTGLRYAAVTNISATCAMDGKIADISGINNNDPAYKNCVTCAYIDIIESQCPTPVIDLCANCAGFNASLPSKPTIDEPIKAGQTVISGTATAGVFIKLSIYSRTGGTDTAPVWSTTAREEHTVLVPVSARWEVPLNGPLLAYDKIVAKAQLTADGSGCGSSDSNNSSTSVTVVEPNAPPVAAGQEINVVEDTPTNIVLVASDPDGDNITYSLVTSPIHGALTGTAPAVTYTPNSNYNGDDSFTFKVNDGILFSTIATVTIHVTPVNDKPVANGQLVTVVEDTATPITLTGSDVEGSALTYSIATNPVNGTISGTGATITYTPFANYTGADTFTFIVNDGTDDSAPATVTINVTEVNDKPVANDQPVTVDEDASVVITLSATDVEGSSLIYTIGTQPAHGSLIGSGANRTYTPNANYHGPDSFTFKVNDGTTDSDIATVSITVNPVNDVPVANDQSIVVTEDTPKAVTLTGSDIDGDALTYVIVDDPSHGTLSGTGANRTYTPDANFYGSDSFTFKVNDGTVDSPTATVSITVTAVGNDAPVANDQSVTTDEEVSVAITMTGSDPDGDVITFSIVGNPAHGSLLVNGASVNYTPDANYSGTDSFTFKVNDGTQDSNTATVSITIDPTNDAPVALNKAVGYDLNTPVNFELNAVDADGDPLTFTVLTQPQPANGVLSGTAPNLTFTPATGFSSSDSFTFRVNDGTVNSNVATVTFVFDNSLVNIAPVAEDQSVNAIEDQSKNIILGATDADAMDVLTFSIVSGPSHGTLSCTNCSNPTYTPTLNYYGADSFTFKVNDGTVDSNDATVTINVSPVNDAPAGDNQNVTVQEDGEIDITFTGSDVEGDAITFVIVTSPAHGVVTGSGATITYKPAANYFGPDSFTFRPTDGSDDGAAATISIEVTPVNDPILAINDDAITTNEDVAKTFSVISNDEDIDGTIDPVSVDLDPTTPAEDKTFTVPGQGTYTADNAGNVTFTPELNYNGVTTPIAYTVKDNDGALSNTATIQVTVTPVNDAPEVENSTITINEDETVSICFNITDVENDPAVFTGGVSLDGNGTLVLDPNTGKYCFLYTPNPDFNGQDEVEVTVCDANDPTICSKGIITIIVNPVNDPPKVVRGGESVDKVTYTTPEDTQLDLCFDVVDPEGGVITVGTITNVIGGGTLVQGTGAAGELCFTFTPAQDFNGESKWSVVLCDDSATPVCATFTITIDVTPVNDAPVANDQNVTTPEDTPVVIALDATDVDGDVITYSVLTNPTHGALTGSGLNITYTPAENYYGPDTFTYKANDGTVDSNTATVSIDVTPVNDAPVINFIPVITVPEDSVVQICVGVFDVDSDVITYNLPTPISGGGTMVRSDTLSFCFIYRPVKDFNGDSFWKFSVCDGGDPSLCSEREVKIVVTPVNDAPVAVNDYITARSHEKTEPVNLLANDTDIENDDLILTTTPEAGPYHGSVTFTADGFMQYRSALGYMGADSVRYKVCDSGDPSLCDTAVVFIEVGPAPFKIYEGLSPNGDGLNDYWRIDGIEVYPNNKVQIFDRYNNLIFETTGYANEGNHWRGQTNHSMVNGNATEGSYYYSINLGDGSDLLSGYVVLKKN